jgi:hypothetical protein
MQMIGFAELYTLREHKSTSSVTAPQDKEPALSQNPGDSLCTGIAFLEVAAFNSNKKAQIEKRITTVILTLNCHRNSLMLSLLPVSHSLIGLEKFGRG